MSERKPTPAECEARWNVHADSSPPGGSDRGGTMAIRRADYVLDLADRIRRERKEQEESCKR